MKTSPGLSSHFPLLVKSFFHTTGDVLEIGMGLYSTPLLHWLCYEYDRKLVSYENDPRYLRIDKSFVSDKHEIKFVENWDDMAVEHNWGLAFIDHAPCERRFVDGIRLAKYARIVVLHDTEPRRDHHYHYSQMYPHYKYRFDWTKVRPNTSVVSNFDTLEFLKDDSVHHSPVLPR